MTHAERPDALQELLRSLTHEVWQTETSASHHCLREAKRYPNSPPESALLAVSRHAERALAEFKGVADREQLPTPSLGSTLGEAFSSAREFIADRTIEAERSYRGTLLGIRHGVDVVQMLALVARQAKNDTVSRWAEAWLVQRRELVRDVDEQLTWFAVNPERARELAH